MLNTVGAPVIDGEVRATTRRARAPVSINTSAGPIILAVEYIDVDGTVSLRAFLTDPTSRSGVEIRDP